MKNPYQDVVRDNQGMGYHHCLEPFFKSTGDREDVSPIPWLEENGFDHAYNELDPFDAAGNDNPAYTAYENDTDLSLWTPERPEGEGWFLAAVYDNEDGVWALFLRPKAAT